MSELPYRPGMTTENKPAASAENSSSSRKSRGPAVPTINLEKAIGLMRKVWEKEKRNAAPVASVVNHWGYKAKSSGGFLAIASLKRFGLLDEHGSNEKRTLKLSNLALDLLKHEATDLAEYLRLLKTAALNPKFHREMWTKYGTELPSDQTIESYLVFDQHFSEDTAKDFIREYKDTIAFAKLAEGDTVPETGGQNETADENQEKTPKIDPPAPPQTPKGPSMSANVRYLSIPLDIGDAPVPMGMSKGDWRIFIDALRVFKSRIVKGDDGSQDTALDQLAEE
jgi:hypothetical protein